jgi:hypothetical protein
MMRKTLDEKLARIAANSSCRDFILADAKDPDMGFGIAAPGPRLNAGTGQQPYRSLPEVREAMRQIVRQGFVDIMLMSGSTSELLTIDERLFDSSTVTPAVRANDTTDIWCGLSGGYSQQPSLPFRTGTIDHFQCGRYPSTPEDRGIGANLGLYSMTFNNDASLDREALHHYREFRLEAEQKGFRHFLEVFAPNAPRQPIADVGRFVNDSIVRCLAGVTRSARPLFLKIPYFGPAAMESLASYDPSLVIGILGGSAGTTYGAFYMLWEAKRYGARAALFGRKINNAEDQLAFVRYLWELANGNIEPREAVCAYHADLERAGIQPLRPLEDDLTQ